MRNNIFWLELSFRLRSTLIWSVGLFSMALMFTALFEQFKEQIDSYQDAFNDGFTAVFGDISQAGTPAGFLGVELYALFLPISLAIIAVGFGASAIGKEEKEGTLELLLASPISRRKIYTQKAFALEVQLAIVAFSVWLGVALGTLLFTFDVSLLNVFWATLMALLLGLTYGFFTLMVQAITGRRSVALGIGSGLVALSYIANVVSQLVDNLDFLKYLSPFYYYDGGTVLIEGLNIGNFAILLSVIIACFLIGLAWFNKRDTGV